MDITAVIAAELHLRPAQVQTVAELLDAGNTIPFLARYRKEMTGELDEEQLRQVEARLNYLRNLVARQEEVIRLIDEQGRLTEELAASIRAAVKLQEVEDLYRPYRPKKRTRAMIAREKGLAPLAELMLAQEAESGALEDYALPYVDPAKGVADAAEALAGAMDIVAEQIADDPRYRAELRRLAWEEGALAAKSVSEIPHPVYRMYADYREPLRRIPPHRILAANRGEKEEALRVEVEVDQGSLAARLRGMVRKNPRCVFASLLEKAADDALARLLWPSLAREIRGELTARAEEHAIRIFAVNLRHLLLQPPVRGRRVMGIDPGYRTGCKVAVIDETGTLLAVETIYPHPPQQKREEALVALARLVDEHRVDLVAIGNGTASRETEALAAELIARRGGGLAYTIVSEAGASVYSASAAAREEFPALDVSMRGAVSIARRLQDPLAELVKIDPQSIGVGQYQHDVDQKELGASLGRVVESCVNYVGVDLNTASPALLGYVAGLQPAVARNIVAHREANGRFRRRADLRLVKRMGEKAFTQAAGFLRIPDGDDPLDATAVHPESYGAARALLARMGCAPEDLRSNEGRSRTAARLEAVDAAACAGELGVGVPTLRDIIASLTRPGRDPREDEPRPVFRTDVLSLEDLRPGMILPGTVRNVVDFGVFVDIGVKQDGLVHLSELAERYIKHPTEVASIGDQVEVRVLGVDLERRRISLSMRPPRE
ncbi:MAG: Tex family protein [Patescibacteria group bacterium]